MRRRGRAKGGLDGGIDVIEKEIRTDLEKKNEIAAVRVRIEGKKITCILTYIWENRKEN